MHYKPRSFHHMECNLSNKDSKSNTDARVNIVLKQHQRRGFLEPTENLKKPITSNRNSSSQDSKCISTDGKVGESTNNNVAAWMVRWKVLVCTIWLVVPVQFSTNNSDHKHNQTRYHKHQAFNSCWSSISHGGISF